MLNKGGETSHTAILARTLGIPAILDTVNATEVIASGDTAGPGLRSTARSSSSPPRTVAGGDRPQDRKIPGKYKQELKALSQPAGADPRPAPVPPLRQHRTAFRKRDRPVLRRQGHRPVPHRVPLPRLQDEHLARRSSA
ncbi:MAG: PEP-utilizing enzyme [Marinilabiliales bacterium]|nr:PEP-utilizing enzyme [Marinilabiliales bacterium]